MYTETEVHDTMESDTTTEDTEAYDRVLHAVESLLGKRVEVDARTSRIVHDGTLEEFGGTLEEARESTMTKQDYTGFITFERPIAIRNTKSTAVRGYEVEFYGSSYRAVEDGPPIQMLELSMRHESGYSLLLEIHTAIEVEHVEPNSS